MNVAGIHYGSGNEGQTGLATNINYIIHQILLHNQPCFPHVESISKSVVEYWKPNSNVIQLRLQLVRRIPKQRLIRVGEKDPDIFGMSYNSARDELLLADFKNEVVRAMRVRDNAGDLRDVYRAPHGTSIVLYCVCHMRDSDTLLVCLGEVGPDGRVPTGWWH